MIDSRNGFNRKHRSTNRYLRQVKPTMIRDTTIRRPLIRQRFIKIEKWHLEICEGNQSAAALLSFLCAYHNGRQDDKLRAAEINLALRKRGRGAAWNETDWQFHTDKMLRGGVLLFKTDAIHKGIEFLRRKDLISTAPPQELKDLFKTGRTKWFLVQTEQALNLILNANLSKLRIWRVGRRTGSTV